MKIPVETPSHQYEVVIGNRNLTEAVATIDDKINKADKLIVLTDEHVWAAHKQTFTDVFPYDFTVHVMPAGEACKTFENYYAVQTFLLEQKATRKTMIFAFGGGAVGDLTGYVAATFMRGVPFVQIPTTILAHDSAVGGKTAINHPLGKNMIGAFYQPKSVIIDTNCLATLPDREFAAGMAEVIKYGIIYDQAFFIWLEENLDKLYAQDEQALTYAIARCCAIKAEVVSLDEKESGIRALLNLGHTFGHAIEAELGYGNWLHGEAVSAGTVMAAKTAHLQSLITEQQLNRIIAILERAKLPIHTPESMSFDDFMKHMMRDKKVLSGKLRLILPTGIGCSEVVSDVPGEQIKRAIDFCRR